MRGDRFDADCPAAAVADAGELRRLIAHAVTRHGRHDVPVNSAGVQRYGIVVETDEAAWDEVMAINLKGTFLAPRQEIPALLQRGGAIVNLSSVQGFASRTGVAAYGTSKAAIMELTRAMAVDHAAERIRADAGCPASVKTPMLRTLADRFKGAGTKRPTLDPWGAMRPIGRVGRPEEVAELFSLLTGPRAGFITGGEDQIDGGTMAALGVHLPG